jgi:hypothetical protein
MTYFFEKEFISYADVMSLTLDPFVQQITNRNEMKRRGTCQAIVTSLQKE